MKYDALIQSFKEKGFKLIKYGKVRELGRDYNLYKIIISSNSKKTLLITSGFHGEEFNASVSLLKIISEAIAYSTKKKVNLIIYPCINPSGFDLKQRYNASNETQNNDFMRYEIKREVWTDILRKGMKFLSYKFVDSKAKEVRLLKNDLSKMKRIPVGVIDIHQDDNLKRGDFYAYIFDKKDIYERIMQDIEKHAKRCRNVKSLNYNMYGVRFNDSIGKDGFIILHDGTLGDMFYRLGSSFVVTAETNTKLKINKVSEINKIWIFSLIDLASKGNRLDLKMK